MFPDRRVGTASGWPIPSAETRQNNGRNICAACSSAADSVAMPERPAPSTDSSASEEHIDVIHRLADEIRVLRDVLDEVREHISYALRNPTPAGCSVVKQMGLDPTSDHWGQHLVITSSAARSTSENDQSDQSPELQQARDTIRELLGVCELNLDELEESTRAVIERARGVLADPRPEAPVESVAELPPPNSQSVPTNPGRLF